MPKMTLQVFSVPKRCIKRPRGVTQPVRGGRPQAVHLISFAAFNAHAIQGVVKNRLEEGAYLSIGEA